MPAQLECERTEPHCSHLHLEAQVAMLQAMCTEMSDFDWHEAKVSSLTGNKQCKQPLKHDTSPDAMSAMVHVQSSEAGVEGMLRTYQAAASTQIQTPFACPSSSPPLKVLGHDN